MIAQRTDTLVLATALIACLTYLAASLDGLVMLPTIVGILGGRLLTGPVGSGKSLPGELVSLAVLGVISLILIVALSTGFDIELFSRLIAGLLTLKAFERRSVRDLVQILLLSVFLLIGALLSDSQLLVGLGLLLMIPMVVACSMGLQIMKATTLAGVHEHSLTTNDRKSFRRTATVVTSLGLVGAVAIFLMIPRGLAQQAFGDWGEVSIGNSVGFDDEINLDVGGLISDSQTPVLDLQVLNRDGTQAGQLGTTFYLRGAVLDTYENRTWRLGVTRREPNTDRYTAGQTYQYQAGSPSTRTNPRAWELEQRVILRNAEPNRTYIFGSWEPLAISFEQTTNLQFRQRVGTARLESSGGKLSYSLQFKPPDPSEIQTILASLSPPENPVSFPNEIVTEFASQLLREESIEPDPTLRPPSETFRVIRLFEEQLRQQFGYTLSPNAPPENADPIEWFLLTERQGHCELFASAMTAMCRSVGINARIVTGYIATEFNDLTGFYTVRESNAHAWVEVQIIPGDASGRTYDPGVWLPYDPTPPGELRNIHDPKTNWLARMQRLIETAEFAWINSVVGFGAETQQGIVGSISTPGWLARLDSKAETRIRSGGRRLIAIAFAAGIGAFAACVVGLTMLGRLRELFGWRWRWSWRPRFNRRRSHAEHPELVSATQHVLRVLRRAGAPKPIGTPLQRHLESQGATLGDSRQQAALQIAGLVYRNRFGSHELATTELESLRAAVREVTSKPR